MARKHRVIAVLYKGKVYRLPTRRQAAASAAASERKALKAMLAAEAEAHDIESQQQ